MFTHQLKRSATLLALILAPSSFAAALDNELLVPATIIQDQSISAAQRQAQILAARRYYTFWHTGDARFAKAVLASNFMDLNLPEGRPQGPEGPLQAAEFFRAAVPDLKAEVVEMLIVGDRVIGRLRFTGHFTGTFKNQQGKGQPIDFSAVDIYRIAQGKIVENWHLEDNLTLLQQLDQLHKQ